jgi:nucleoside-diphosphate-sugar epimerase
MNILLTGSTGFVGSYFIDKYTINTFSFLNNNFNKLDLESIKEILN